MHFFCNLGMTSKRIGNPLKKLFKTKKLCYSIEEAYCMFNNHITWIASAGASDRNILAYGSFNIWWRNITKKELSANLYSNREICFVRVFSVGLLNDYVRGNQFGKVVHDQSGKDLLVYVLHLFCVEVK